MTTGLADESDGMVLLGWSREKIKNHVTLRSKIGAEILFFAKNFQEGRAPNFGAAAPKNERDVTLRSKIGAEILFLAKNFQAGRAPSNGAFAPKNERGVTLRSQIGTEILVFGKNLSGWPRAKLWHERAKK